MNSQSGRLASQFTTRLKRFQKLAVIPLMSGLVCTSPSWAEDVPLIRLSEAHYVDGVASPAGIDRPSPRAISNIVHAQHGSVPNPVGATDFVWQWG